MKLTANQVISIAAVITGAVLLSPISKQASNLNRFVNFYVGSEIDKDVIKRPAQTKQGDVLRPSSASSGTGQKACATGVDNYPWEP